MLALCRREEVSLPHRTSVLDSEADRSDSVSAALLRTVRTDYWGGMSKLTKNHRNQKLHLLLPWANSSTLVEDLVIYQYSNLTPISGHIHIWSIVDAFIRYHPFPLYPPVNTVIIEMSMRGGGGRRGAGGTRGRELGCAQDQN